MGTRLSKVYKASQNSLFGLSLHYVLEPPKVTVSGIGLQWPQHLGITISGQCFIHMDSIEAFTNLEGLELT